MNVEDVLGLLASVRRGKNGWTARCPAHDDRHPSLSVGVGDAGQILLNCHTGSSFPSICEALGIEESDLFPARSPSVNAPSKAEAYATPEQAQEAALRSVRCGHGQDWDLAVSYPYVNAVGDEVMRVLRFEPSGGAKKTFRPIGLRDGRWVVGAPGGLLPLYRLHELGGATRVYVCEGEKAADAAASLGLVATTNAHGARSAGKTDWKPLATVDAVVLPDNDVPGSKWAREVAEILTRLKQR